jgi:gamma-carbonic anhydrase
MAKPLGQTASAPALPHEPASLRASLLAFQPVLSGNDPVDALRQQLETFRARKPVLGRGVYIARGAAVLGDVTIGDHSSVWYHAVVRGDINRIVLGHHTNIQDNAVLHLADDFPCLLGHYVTVGHSAIVHACTVGDECLIGMGAVILDGAVIGEQCLIGARALVTSRTQIPAGSLVMGTPAKIVRALTVEERAGLKHWAEKYVANAAYCLEKGINVGGPM